jgi:hypothetical protein
LENDVLVVGHPFYDKPGKIDAGNVLIYKKIGNMWTLVQELTGSHEMANAKFGYSVAINNGRIAVGAYGQTVGGFANSGAVYVFKDNGNGYVEEKILEPQMGNEACFGMSVSLSGSHLLAGAPIGRQGTVKCGVAILHTLAVNTQQWTYAGTWIPSTIQEGMYFGAAVSLFNDIAIVGTPQYNTSDGYIRRFKKVGITWEPDGQRIGLGDANFGCSLATYESGYMVGSHAENGGRVRLFDLAGAEKKIYKDNLTEEGLKSLYFGTSVALHNGAFIIGIPNKGTRDAGAVQFGTIE